MDMLPPRSMNCGSQTISQIIVCLGIVKALVTYPRTQEDIVIPPQPSMSNGLAVYPEHQPRPGHGAEGPDAGIHLRAVVIVRERRVDHLEGRGTRHGERNFELELMNS